MKLHHSPASPYVRKVMACAIARGLDGRIEKVDTNPHVSPASLLADNPLSKVPALVAGAETVGGVAVMMGAVRGVIGFLPSVQAPSRGRGGGRSRR